jgi:hypothetical protein
VSERERDKKPRRGIIFQISLSTQRRRYAFKITNDDRVGETSSLPTRLLLLSVGLEAVRLLLGVATAVRLRRLVGSGLEGSERHSVGAVVRALNARVASASLAQAHYRAAATVFGLSVPQTLVSLVRAVVGVTATRATADGEQPEEGGTDRECGRDPGDCKSAGADIDLDVVRVE